jgi:hypothetical protein
MRCHRRESVSLNRMRGLLADIRTAFSRGLLIVVECECDRVQNS